jgi:hypothetical protein
LTIEIPRALLDSKDSTGKIDDFMVYGAANHEIYADKHSRILELYDAASPTIEGTTSSYSNP